MTKIGESKFSKEIMKKIRKAVVPVAGYGTRFLPATKAMPKEMLPIVDKPVIQYVVEELVEAGIEQIILVTGWHKRAIEDHFDRHLELEHKLEVAGKTEYLDQIKKISGMAEFIYVRQKEQRGNGDAILTAKNVVGDEPFVVCWGDEIMLADPLKTKQLIDAFHKYNGATILGAIRTTDPADTKKYGYPKGKEIEDGVIDVETLIEKPGPENCPSNFATLGGYVYPPEFFDALEAAAKEMPEDKDELVHIDGINKLLEWGHKAYTVEIKGGKHYDCGNVTQYLKTNVEMALRRNDINGEFDNFILDCADKIRAKNQRAGDSPSIYAS